MATYIHTEVNYINVLSPSPSAPRYWVSPIESNFDSSYWSTESGGPPGASVPGASNAIVFDGNGLGNCLFNVPVYALGLTEGPGYTGSLIQNSSSITIGDASFLSGNFIGTNYPVTVYGNLTLSEGFSWQGSDSTISAYGDVYVNQGFSANKNRALTLLGANKQGLYCNGGILPAVHVDKPSSNQVKAFGDYPIYVNDDFIIFDGTFNTNGHNLVMTSINVPVPPPPPTTTTTTTPAPPEPPSLFIGSSTLALMYGYDIETPAGLEIRANGPGPFPYGDPQIFELFNSNTYGKLALAGSGGYANFLMKIDPGTDTWVNFWEAEGFGAQPDWYEYGGIVQGICEYNGELYVGAVSGFQSALLKIKTNPLDHFDIIHEFNGEISNLLVANGLLYVTVEDGATSALWEYNGVSVVKSGDLLNGGFNTLILSHFDGLDNIYCNYHTSAGNSNISKYNISSNTVSTITFSDITKKSASNLIYYDGLLYCLLKVSPFKYRLFSINITTGAIIALSDELDIIDSLSRRLLMSDGAGTFYILAYLPALDGGGLYSVTIGGSSVPLKLAEIKEPDDYYFWCILFSL